MARRRGAARRNSNRTVNLGTTPAAHARALGGLPATQAALRNGREALC